MFEWIKKRIKLKRMIASAERYLWENYTMFITEEPDLPIKAENRPVIDETYNHKDENEERGDKADKTKDSLGVDSGIRFSLRDNYNRNTIQTAMRNLSANNSPKGTLRTIENNTDMTFVDKMLELIDSKQLRDADVYKAAQVDRRLFSKIVSDSMYKPAKDTCIALCFAMKLTLSETNDLLSRAGYTFSHSNKRDVILEYFFREHIYDLIDINEILFRLDQKVLGRV